MYAAVLKIDLNNKLQYVQKQAYEKCQARLNAKSHSVLKITLKAFQCYKILLNSSFHVLLVDQDLECRS